jgi:hypothetical protein
MRAQVVEYDDGSGFDDGSQLGLDIGVECGSVHRALDHPWSDQVAASETCDEGLRAPLAEGRGCWQASTNGCATSQSGQVRLDGGLVDEDQPLRHPPHHRLPVSDPVGASPGDIGAPPFVRDQ